MKTSSSCDPSEICYEGCDCLASSCDESSCTCLKRFGNYYQTTITSGRKLKFLRAIHKHCANEILPPLFECNTMCRCGENCINRLVQNGVTVALEIFVSDHEKGVGLRTIEELIAGQFVCEYAGEVLSYDEAKLRSSKQLFTDMNYIIGVKEHTAGHQLTTFIDPQSIGNVGRFINHSCDPNLIMIPVRVDSEMPRLSLFAKRTIMRNEELTFHYGGNFTPANTTSKGKKICECKSSNCSGFLPFHSSLY